jgi:hypothetical protein
VTGRPRCLRLKLLFVVFALYCFAISTVVRTFLTSYLIDPGYENQLTLLDEILDSGKNSVTLMFWVFFFINPQIRDTEKLL